MTSQDGSLVRLKISAHTRLDRLYCTHRAQAVTDQLMGLVQRYHLLSTTTPGIRDSMKPTPC